MKNRWMLIAAAIVLVMVLAVAGGIYYDMSNNYVATVANEKITKDEYQFFLALAKNQMLSEASLTEEKDKENFLKDKEEAVKNAALELAKEFKIQLIKAKEKKIALTKEDTDNINKNVEQMIQNTEGGKAAAETQIKDLYGVNIEQYKAIYIDYTLINKFITEEKKGMVSEEEVKKYYEENKDTFAQATVRHILLPTVKLDQSNTPLSQEEQDAAKKKAEEVLDKVKAGGDFAALAKEYSEDLGSKESGGEYTFPRGQMVPEFETWSFDKGRKAGDVDIVKTELGYHVMKFEAIKESALEEVKGSILEYLAAPKYTGALEQWKKDQNFNLIKNTKVFNSVKVI